MFSRDFATTHFTSFYILVSLPRKLAECREGRCLWQ
jgi:hypothetical protein